MLQCHVAAAAGNSAVADEAQEADLPFIFGEACRTGRLVTVLGGSAFGKALGMALFLEWCVRILFLSACGSSVIGLRGAGRKRLLRMWK